MNVFIINSGSSSIKYQLFKMPSSTPICSGLVDRIGLTDSTISHKTFKDGKEHAVNRKIEIKDYESGLKEVNTLLTDNSIGVIKNPDEIELVGHRIVHGGEEFTKPTIITADVKKKLKKTFQLAPLHNPSGYKGIEVAEKIFTKATQMAVFDTAFHQTLPPEAYRYAIPDNYYKDYNIRVYGFHGTSHKYVTHQAEKYLNKPDSKLISIHLGNGCSMCAVKVSNLLNKQSGMLGLTGFSDMRDITKAINEDNMAAKLAYDMYAYRIKKYIGAYIAALNGIDAIIFTAGVGENDALLRKLVCKELEYLGIRLDEDKNQKRSKDIREINQPSSPVKILVIPTNEELEIANQCFDIMKK
jgi:acetate kinase